MSRKPQEDPIDDTLHFRLSNDDRFRDGTAAPRCRTLCGIVHWTYYTRVSTPNSRARVTCKDCRWRLAEWFAFHKKPPTLRRWREWEYGNAVYEADVGKRLVSGTPGRQSLTPEQRQFETDRELERQRRERVARADAELIEEAQTTRGGE